MRKIMKVIQELYSSFPAWERPQKGTNQALQWVALILKQAEVSQAPRWKQTHTPQAG